MRNWWCRIVGAFLATVLWLGASDCSAQEVSETPPGVMFRFVRQNNFTWYTQMDLAYQYSKEKYRLQANIHHTNIFNSSLSSGNFVQLYFNSSIWNFYTLNPKLEALAWLETDQYLNTQNEKYSLYGGVNYRPWSFLQIRPMLGYSFDRRAGNLDTGLSPALWMEAKKEWEGGLYMESRGLFRYKFIRPRQQQNFTFRQLWGKNFYEPGENGPQERLGSLVAGIRLGAHELDDYQSESVKRILSDTLNPFLNLTYSLGNGFSWESANEATFQRRRFLYQTLDAEAPAEFNNLAFVGTELSSRQTLSYRNKRFRAYSFYDFYSRNRDYELTNNREESEPVFQTQLEREETKDFESRQHWLETFGSWEMSKKHRLQGKYQAKYRQYDTPAEQNFDDRDEITYLGNLEWVAAWQPGFRSRIGISAAYRHYAFLFAEKSQDNYKQRSLRYFFNFDWDLHEYWRIEGNNAVYVTYNVKDFLDVNLTDRSTRNLETNYRLQFRPNRNFQSRLSLNRRETHQSYLNWEAFSETTLDTTTWLTLELSNRYFFNVGAQNGARIYADLGYKHFDQTKRFQTNMFDLQNILTTINLNEINLQTGPQFAIGLRDKHNSSIDFSFWMQYQIRKNKYGPANGVSIYGSTVYESDLQNTQSALFPYIDCSLNYFFK